MQNTPDSLPESPPVPRHRRKWKRWALLFCLLAGALVLNGPGFRWLVPKVAAHYAGKSGFRGDFGIEGSLLGGFSIHDLRVESEDTLARLELKRFTPSYRISKVVRGELDGLTLHGLHADLRLDTKDADKAGKSGGKKSTPPDLEGIVRTVRSLRGMILPVAIDLREVSVNATRDGKPFFAIGPSSFSHAPGSPDFELKLGALTDPTQRQWPPQASGIAWREEEVRVERLDPLPGIGLRDLSLRMPGDAPASMSTELVVDGGVIEVDASPGFSSATLNLREGSIAVHALLKRFGIEPPAVATITSLSLQADSLLPDPKSATGDLRVLLEDITRDDASVPELSLDLSLEAGMARVAASGQSLGTGFSVDAEAPLVRDGGSLVPGMITGRFNVAEVSQLVASLAAKNPAIDPGKPLPPSMLDGTYRIELQDMRPSSASVDGVLKPADAKAAASIALKAAWKPDEPASAQVSSEGITVDAAYDVAAQSYTGRIDLKEFTTLRLQPWLSSFRVAGVEGLELSGNWLGSGSIAAKTHQGSLDLAKLTFSRPEMPPLVAVGGVDYRWPGQVATKGLVVESGEQKVSAQAALADGILRLDQLSWLHQGRSMAGGRIEVPVPEDFSRWRDLLSRDVRPLAVSIDSEVLPLSLLKDWVPEASKLDPRSTGRLSVKVAGTFAKPEIDATLDLRDLRSPEQPKLLPADLRIRLAGRDGSVTLDGSVVAPGYPPATLGASMPFRPAVWAETPQAVLEEPLSARVDLPRLDLSRFSSLVPQVRAIRGVITGNAVAAGKIGKPELKGRIDLSAAGVEFADASLPPVTGAGAALDLSLERVVLRDLKATIAGGTVQGGGSLNLVQGAPGPLDFRLVGRHLPIRRDESLIVRADADLRLAGPWQSAALTGTVGVVDSLFYRDIELLPIGTPFTTPAAASLPKLDAPAKAAASSVPEPFRNWTINVRARTVNPFLIRGNFATGRIDADLRVGGTLGKPAPDGEVKITDFKAALPFSTLTVRSGTIRFTPASGFDPILEIRGRAEPRPYRVNAFIYGPASNPQLVLTSNPPLPENEIMTLLATGTTTTGLEDPQAASSRAMQLLAEELRRGRFAVGKRLRPLLGLLDRVDFSVAEADPYTSESFSTATLAVTDNWFVSAGMGAEGDSRVLGIWRISFR